MVVLKRYRRDQERRAELASETVGAKMGFLEIPRDANLETVMCDPMLAVTRHSPSLGFPTRSYPCGYDEGRPVFLYLII